MKKTTMLINNLFRFIFLFFFSTKQYLRKFNKSILIQRKRVRNMEKVWETPAARPYCCSMIFAKYFGMVIIFDLKKKVCGGKFSLRLSHSLSSSRVASAIDEKCTTIQAKNISKFNFDDVFLQQPISVSKKSPLNWISWLFIHAFFKMNCLISQCNKASTHVGSNVSHISFKKCHTCLSKNCSMRLMRCASDNGLMVNSRTHTQKEMNKNPYNFFAITDRVCHVRAKMIDKKQLPTVAHIKRENCI